jgi:hypothetical protein
LSINSLDSYPDYTTGPKAVGSSARRRVLVAGVDSMVHRRHPAGVGNSASRTAVVEDKYRTVDPLAGDRLDKTGMPVHHKLVRQLDKELERSLVIHKDQPA